MALRLYPPRGPKNPYYIVRGSYWGVKGIYRSTGTAGLKEARAFLKKTIDNIKSGAFPAPEASTNTFSAAMTSYVNAGGDDRFLDPIHEMIGVLPLEKINQAKVDAVAVELYPNATPATRNRQVYTPVSAVLRHAGIVAGIRRPKGAQGTPRTAYLTEDEAFRFLDAAEALQPRFGALCVFYLYTGCRLSEALRLTWADVDLSRGHALIRETKNGEPRPVFLPEAVVASLANLNSLGVAGGASTSPGTQARVKSVQASSTSLGANSRVFRFAKAGRLYDLFREAAANAGLTIPPRVAFHLFRHTWGVMMRRYAGLDTSGLVATGAWKSHDAARIYEHVEISVEAQKASMLPVRRRG